MLGSCFRTGVFSHFRTHLGIHLMNQVHDSHRQDISKWTPDDVWNWLSKQEFANELQVAHFRLINGELLQRLSK